jgi:hypothetical protein
MNHQTALSLKRRIGNVVDIGTFSLVVNPAWFLWNDVALPAAEWIGLVKDYMLVPIGKFWWKYGVMKFGSWYLKEVVFNFFIKGVAIGIPVRVLKFVFRDLVWRFGCKFLCRSVFWRFFVRTLLLGGPVAAAKLVLKTREVIWKVFVKFLGQEVMWNLLLKKLLWNYTAKHLLFDKFLCNGIYKGIYKGELYDSLIRGPAISTVDFLKETFEADVYPLARNLKEFLVAEAGIAKGELIGELGRKGLLLELDENTDENNGNEEEQPAFIKAIENWENDNREKFEEYGTYLPTFLNDNDQTQNENVSDDKNKSKFKLSHLLSTLHRVSSNIYSHLRHYIKDFSKLKAFVTTFTSFILRNLLVKHLVERGPFYVSEVVNEIGLVFLKHGISLIDSVVVPPLASFGENGLNLGLALSRLIISVIKEVCGKVWDRVEDTSVGKELGRNVEDVKRLWDEVNEEVARGEVDRGEVNQANEQQRTISSDRLLSPRTIIRINESIAASGTTTDSETSSVKTAEARNSRLNDNSDQIRIEAHAAHFSIETNVIDSDTVPKATPETPISRRSPSSSSSGSRASRLHILSSSSSASESEIPIQTLSSEGEGDSSKTETQIEGDSNRETSQTSLGNFKASAVPSRSKYSSAEVAEASKSSSAGPPKSSSADPHRKYPSMTTAPMPSVSHSKTALPLRSSSQLSTGLTLSQSLNSTFLRSKRLLLILLQKILAKLFTSIQNQTKSLLQSTKKCYHRFSNKIQELRINVNDQGEARGGLRAWMLEIFIQVQKFKILVRWRLFLFLKKLFWDILFWTKEASYHPPLNLLWMALRKVAEIV